MTEAQQIQYDRFIAAGYSPDDAATLIARGAWLGTEDVSPQTVADVNRYRAERDAKMGRGADREAAAAREG